MAKGTANGAGHIIDLKDANKTTVMDLVLAAILAIDQYSIQFHIALKELDEAAEGLQKNVAFLNGCLGRFGFDVINVDPDRAINEVLKRNKLEIVRNGNGHAD